jgi:hypothetical protein
MFRIPFALMACFLALGACSGTDDNHGDDDNGGDGGGTDMDGGGDTDTDSDSDSDTGTDDGKGCELMDILFVIDDSASMECEQTQLGQAFPQFVQVLDDYNNANADAISYRLAVTSTGRDVKGTYSTLGINVPFNEKGMNGKMAMPSGSSVPWIDGPASSVATAFGDLASIGTGGPTYEMPLECLREALQKTEAGQPNEGFLRENALFIAVIITDEDDCSSTANNFTIPDDGCSKHDAQPAVAAKYQLEDLQAYEDYLTGKFGGEGRFVIITIAGKNGCDSSAVNCSGDSAYEGALSAPRLADFMGTYVGADHGLFSDICTIPMPNALATALEKIEVACDDYVPVE